jgi:hypothetical protein
VARRIASLETLLGRMLFDRRAKGYALTAEGRAVSVRARRRYSSKSASSIFKAMCAERKRLTTSKCSYVDDD